MKKILFTLFVLSQVLFSQTFTFTAIPDQDETKLKERFSKLAVYLTKELGSSDYEIIETEMGSIPMTCYDFQEHHSTNIRYIGTAGGWAKPSTGYTFASTVRKIPVLLDYIKTGKPLHKLSFKNRFWFYDLLFLDVLYKDNANGRHIFETLFKNRNPKLIFKFLDEQTTFLEDIKYILGCPKKPFVKALFSRLF